MKIIVETIPMSDQRYPTLGDWLFARRSEGGGNLIQDDKADTLFIFVTETGDDRANTALALHEIAEAMLCREAGISQFEVDRFDMEWTGQGEPGDEPDAPYHVQHRAANRIERSFIEKTNLSLAHYIDLCDAAEGLTADEKP